MASAKRRAARATSATPAKVTLEPTTNLPGLVEPLVGRAIDRAALASLFDEGARLVTIVGPGGMGKTHLATTFASSRVEVHSKPGDGGAWMCDLTSSKTVADVCAAIASVLGLERLATTTTSSSELAIELARALHRRGRILLVLDNFEQLVAEGENDAVTAISTLLRHAPRLRLLITSRVALDVPGEYRWPLQGLELPAPDVSAAAASSIRDVESVALFLRRAKQVRPDLVIDDEALRAIAAIATLLEGIPLAIELAAARTVVMSPAEIRERLGSGRGSDDVLVRQRDGGRHGSMRAVVADSFRALDERDRACLVACTIFEDGITLDAATAVIGEGALAALGTLVLHSLVRTRGEGAASRFTLYEVVREYAESELEARSGLREEIELRHAAYFVARAREVTKSAAELRSELRNLLRAHETLSKPRFGSGDDDSVAQILCLTMVLEPLLRARGLSALRVELLARTIDRTRELARDGAHTSSFVDVLIARGHAHAELGALDSGKADLDEAIGLARHDGNRAAEALAHIRMGAIVERRGDTKGAIEHFVTALACAEKAGPRVMSHAAIARASLAHAYRREGRLEEAETEVTAAITAFRALGDEDGLCEMVFEAGVLDLFRRRYETAASRFDEALAIAVRSGARHREASIHAARGTMEQELGNIERARELYASALKICRESGSAYAEASTLYYLGGAHFECGQRDDAHAILTQALQLMRSVGVPRYEALMLGALGALRAHAGFEKEAHALFAEAASAAQACNRELALLATLDIHRLELDLFSATTPADAAKVVERASLLSNRHTCDDPRFAFRILSLRAKRVGERAAEATPTLVIREGGVAFRLPKGASDVELGRRPPLARILHALARSRVSSPGDGLGVEDILRAGWPNERVRHDAGANRVYVALAELRKLGLREWLLSDATGYRLATSRAVVLERPA